MVTGATTSVGTVTVGGMSFGATALEFGDDGVLYTVPSMQDALFGHVLTVDPGTALATDLGDAALTQGAVSLTFKDPAAGVPDTTLAAWDTSNEDLWMVETADPISSTLVGGDNVTILPEIEFFNGVIYGADTFENTDLHMIDPTTGVSFDTVTLTFPPEGDVITALEFVGGTLYAGLTTEGGGATFLSTVDTGTGGVTVIGATGVNSPFGGLAYEVATGTMFAISSGGSDAKLYTINMVSGAATEVALITFGAQPFRATALEFGGDGMLYTAASFQEVLFGHVFTIDTMTGEAMDLGDAGMDQGPVALTYTGVMFEDGFESGDSSVWSNTVP